MSWLVGIDVGGSSSRARAVHGDGRIVDSVTQGVGAHPEGMAEAIEAALDTLLARESALTTEGVRALGVGSSGFGTLARDVPALQLRLANRLGTPHVSLAADAVAAHLGALGGEPGAMIAAGTGAIALSLDLDGAWRRVDGWGHLLGDLGGAAWIGQRGLTAAFAAHDGRDPAGASLLASGTEQFGDPFTWPSQVYGRHDRAGVMASFASRVSEQADAGDAAALEIITAAGRALATTAVASLVEGVPPVVAWTGGVFASSLVLEAFSAEVARVRPDVEVREAAASPLEGSLVIARKSESGDHGSSVEQLILW